MWRHEGIDRLPAMHEHTHGTARHRTAPLVRCARPHLAAKEHNALPQQQAERIASHVLRPAAHKVARAAGDQAGQGPGGAREAAPLRRRPPALARPIPAAPPATNLGGMIGCWEARMRPLSLLLWEAQVTAAAACRRATAGARPRAWGALLLLLRAQRGCTAALHTAVAALAIAAGAACCWWGCKRCQEGRADGDSEWQAHVGAMGNTPHLGQRGTASLSSPSSPRGGPVIPSCLSFSRTTAPTLQLPSGLPQLSQRPACAPAPVPPLHSTSGKVGEGPLQPAGAFGLPQQPAAACAASRLRRARPLKPACPSLPQPPAPASVGRLRAVAMEHQLSTSALAKLARDLKELQAQPIDGVKVRWAAAEGGEACQKARCRAGGFLGVPASYRRRRPDGSPAQLPCPAAHACPRCC